MQGERIVSAVVDELAAAGSIHHGHSDAEGFAISDNVTLVVVAVSDRRLLTFFQKR
jgi:hypothetical protein